jgi:hypothetical protein
MSKTFPPKNRQIFYVSLSSIFLVLYLVFGHFWARGVQKHHKKYQQQQIWPWSFFGLGLTHPPTTRASGFCFGGPLQNPAPQLLGVGEWPTRPHTGIGSVILYILSNPVLRAFRDLGLGLGPTGSCGRHDNRVEVPRRKGPQKKNPGTPVVGGWVRGQRRTRVSFFPDFFKIVFLNSPHRETPKNVINKIEKKSVLDFWSIFFFFDTTFFPKRFL